MSKLSYRIAGIIILIIEFFVLDSMFSGNGYVDLYQALATIVIVGAITMFALILIVG